MNLGPHADAVLELVELAESGAILRDPRPHLAGDVKVLHDPEEILDYRMVLEDTPNREDWRPRKFPGGDILKGGNSLVPCPSPTKWSH